MKLKRNCIFFNAKVNQNGRTPDWGHELGQSDGYLMKEIGCSEILNGLLYNKVDPIHFSYGSGGTNYDYEIISIFRKTNIKVFDSISKVSTDYEINKPFILIVTKENKGVHLGRRTLKMNKGFSFNGKNLNEDFYDSINLIVTNPWFGYKLEFDSIKSGILTLTIIKAPDSTPIPSDPTVKYIDAKSRKSVWDGIVDDYYSRTRRFSSVQNKIFFGAPGTGKSFKVQEYTKTAEIEGRVERITFHPESDYSSFVGGYKPIMFEDNIRYEFVPQAFSNIYVKAWNDLDNEYYLVIEEINRGNCAEIFGDIFQILDRNCDYKVTPSRELKEHLHKELSESIYVDTGKLILPPNLNIYATMNTSDQSLFPMDSAFKRRWDWEYIPINYSKNYIDEKGVKKENKSFSYVVIDNETDKNKLFDWIIFIKAVNQIIKSNENLGMDKCIGNFFVKPNHAELITLDVFINKVIFYLWNDVFKDEEDSENIFPKNKFYEDFFPIKENGSTILELVINKVNEIVKNENYEVDLVTWKK